MSEMKQLMGTTDYDQDFYWHDVTSCHVTVDNRYATNYTQAIISNESKLALQLALAVYIFNLLWTVCVFELALRLMPPLAATLY